MNRELSIIIPTYKRKESLLRLLKSLVPEMKNTFEIIVVEQVLSNKRVFENFAQKNHLHFTYVFLNESSTPHAKNVGASIAKGRYLIFFDDDVTVEKGIFQSYLKSFKKHPIIAGRVITPGQIVTEQSRQVGKITYFGKFTDDFSSTIPQFVDTVIGCNAGWRKDVFEKVGGFDEQITMNGIREESDLSLRAKTLGYKIYFEPTALACHLREASGGGRKTEGRLWWYYNYLSNETYFFLKYRPWWITGIVLLTRWEWFLRCMFGFGREVSIRSILTPFAGVWYGIQKYNKWKRQQKGLLIGVDAGCLGISDKRLKVGVYRVAENLLSELGKIDTKNTYYLYSFYPIEKKVMKKFGKSMKNIVVTPSFAWLKLWLPLQLMKDRPDVFLGLSQSLPWGGYKKSLVLAYDLAYQSFPEYYNDYQKLKTNTDYAVKKASNIVAISNFTKNTFVKYYPGAKNKLSVAYLGNTFSSVHTFSKVEKYFLFVGALKPLKNLPTVLKAFEEFTRLSKTSHRLLIVGGNKWEDKALSKTLGRLPDETKKQIQFLGVVPDEKLQKLYQHATALLMPSEYEGFGLPALEAMSQGCPVIASTIPALTEVIQNAGVLLPAKDYKKFAVSMQKVATDRKFREKLQENGLKQVNTYSWVRFASQIHSIITSL